MIMYRSDMADVTRGCLRRGTRLEKLSGAEESTRKERLECRSQAGIDEAPFGACQAHCLAVVAIALGEH